MSRPIHTYLCPACRKTIDDSELANQCCGVSPARIFIRKSGTESLLRILVEHEDEVYAKDVCKEIEIRIKGLFNER